MKGREYCYYQTFIQFYTMITSSQFFEKSFFTFDTGEQRIQADDVGPWGVIQPKPSLNQKQIGSPSNGKKNPNINRGYQLSRNSSLKYIEKKLKAKSNLNKSRQMHTIEQYKKYSTIQQNLPSIQSKNSKQAESIEIVSRVKRNKKKSQIFPELTINQYNDIKAKGSSLMSTTNAVEEILERRKNRRKILQEFGKASSKQSIKLDKRQNKTKSTEGKSVLSGRYVYIAKNPQFSVNGQPTTKLLDQY